MSQLVHKVYEKKIASHISTLSINQQQVVTKGGRQYVHLKTGIEKYSKCLAYLKAVGLLYAVLYTAGLVMISKKVRAHFVDSFKVLLTGERMVERYRRIS